MPRVNVEGVGTVNFPDSMAPEEIRAAIERDILPQMRGAGASQPTQPPQAPQAPDNGPRTRLGQLVSNLMASGGSLPMAMLPQTTDLRFGAKQALDAVAQIAARATGTGVPQTEAANAQSLADYKATQPETRTGAELARGVGNSIPLTVATGGASFGPGLARTIATGAGYGAGAGLLTPVYDATDNADFARKKAGEIGKGAAIGGATGGVVDRLGAVISPTLAKGAQMMKDSDIATTIGQRMGGLAKSFEDKMTSLPIIGDLINSQRLTGISDFNRAVYRKALAPLGEEGMVVANSAPFGNAGVKQVGDFLSANYEKALAASRPNVVTPEFTASLDNLTSMVPVPQQAELSRIINQNITSKITPGQTLTPSVAKDAESELGRMAAQYNGSANPEHRELSVALRQAQEELRGLVAKNNPEMAPVIQATNDGWSTLVQMENAAKMAGARKDGIFTPNQFIAAVQNGAGGVRKRTFTRGDAKNQEFAQAAAEVLPNQVADSGTTGRAMVATTLAGGGLHLMGLTPETATTMGLASLPYLPGVGPLLTNLLTNRPAAAATLGDLVKRAAPFAGAAVSSSRQ